MNGPYVIDKWYLTPDPIVRLHYAQAIAEQIGREVKRFHFEPKVQAMDDYPNFQAWSN